MKIVEFVASDRALNETPTPANYARVGVARRNDRS
jgi:hypothetical protein